MHGCILISINTRFFVVVVVVLLSFFPGIDRKPCGSFNLGEIWVLQVTVWNWSVCRLYTKTILYQPQAIGVEEGVDFLFIRGDMSSGAVAKRPCCSC